MEEAFEQRKVTWEAKDVAAKYALLLRAESAKLRKLSKRERGIVRAFWRG